jgi:predicted transcriptional regulator
VRHIFSVWELELLLFLRRENRPLTESQLARAMYMDSGALQPGLQHLINCGVVVRSKDGPKEHDTYLFQPKPELAQTIEELATTYAEKRLKVINIIFAKPMLSFADAFKLRKDSE